MLLEQEDQLKENIRVLRAEQNALIKEVEVLNHNKNLGQLSDKCMEVQKVSNDLVRKNDEILNLAEDYFKHGYAPKEQKMVFEKLCKETDMFHEQREKQNQENEALKPLARHLEDFDKAYIQERLKKRKSLNEVPAEYS
jgi:predicted outer membrane protein